MKSIQRFWTAILLTTLLVGTLDGLAATFQFIIGSGGKNPAIVFRYIASGVLGESVQNYSLLSMAGLGLFFHYCIAGSFTLFFFWIYPNFPVFHRNRTLTGVIYGVFVWVVMNLVVLPLSNVQRLPFSASKAILAAGILILMIGLPIALMARRYFDPKD